MHSDFEAKRVIHLLNLFPSTCPFVFPSPWIYLHLVNSRLIADVAWEPLFRWSQTQIFVKNSVYNSLIQVMSYSINHAKTVWALLYRKYSPKLQMYAAAFRTVRFDGKIWNWRSNRRSRFCPNSKKCSVMFNWLLTFYLQVTNLCEGTFLS